ncbi:hypothetical protein [Modestobacter excelsi]|uniref:hypothetical protein n=1 Tax=Modestobacter excelsi TaxID=2213161 RepID=UPI00110CF608|nr:hypothetical protein [Modestobacter excelsi]
MTVTTMPASSSRSGGCGCSGGAHAASGGCRCGGSPAPATAGFTRPRFFAGQLLTEDDLQLLIDYVTGKDRLRNRLLFGPGVVSGLEVFCAPCGGGDVVVTPGYALDCCGSEIVVGCPQTVPVTDLVHEMRVRGLGVDCGDPCAEPDGSGEEGEGTRTRHYGLYIRYAEADAEPVAPYATQEPCGPVGCVPSRVREGFILSIKCPQDPPDHRYRPGDTLRRALGELSGFLTVWSRGRRLGQYRERLRAAALAEDTRIVFEATDARHLTAALDGLRALLERTGGDRSPALDRQMTETVRTLAAAVARYDLYDEAGQKRLREHYDDLSQVEEARTTLGRACDWLGPTVDDSAGGPDSTGVSLPERTWPDAARRGVARAVVGQTRAQVLAEGNRTPMEQRLVALGAPLDRPLRSDLRRDLARLREWLLIRLETSAEVTSCDLRVDVARIVAPLPLPEQDEGDAGTVGAAELKDLATLADAVYVVLFRYLVDLVCGSLLPSPTDCADTDVLLASLEVDDCTVIRICAADREQVLPGGATYSAWLPQLYELQELAGRVCCGPVPKDTAVKAGDGVHLPFGPGWLSDQPDASDLGRLLALVGATSSSSAVNRSDAATRSAPAATTSGVAPAPDQDVVGNGVPASGQEIAALRGQLAAVTARLTELESRTQPPPGEGPAVPPAGQPVPGPSGSSPPAKKAVPVKKTAPAGTTVPVKKSAVAKKAAPATQGAPAAEQGPAAEKGPAAVQGPGAVQGPAAEPAPGDGNDNPGA